jgi:hypothetical protein
VKKVDSPKQDTAENTAQEQGVGRREILRRAGIGAGALALGAAAVDLALPAQAGAASMAPVVGVWIEGTWLAAMTAKSSMMSESAMGSQNICTYNAGGGVLETGSTDQASGLRSSPGAGTWMVTGPNTCHYTVKSFSFDDKGNLAAIETTSETLTRDVTGDVYTGKGKYKVVDLKGKVVDMGTIASRAERVKADEM